MTMHRLQLLALDIDGVLTDNTVLLLPNGEEAKRVSFSDLDAVTQAKQHGFAVAMVTGETGPMVRRIAERFGVEKVLEGAKDKLAALQSLSQDMGIPLNSICYVGDSDRDAPALQAAGLGLAPHTASAAARNAADCVHYELGVTAAAKAVQMMLRHNRILSSTSEAVRMALPDAPAELVRSAERLAAALARASHTWILAEPQAASVLLSQAYAATSGLTRGDGRPFVRLGVLPWTPRDIRLDRELLSACGYQDVLLFAHAEADPELLASKAEPDQTVIVVKGMPLSGETEAPDADPLKNEWRALWKGASAVWRTEPM